MQVLAHEQLPLRLRVSVPHSHLLTEVASVADISYSATTSRTVSTIRSPFFAPVLVACSSEDSHVTTFATRFLNNSHTGTSFEGCLYLLYYTTLYRFSNFLYVSSGFSTPTVSMTPITVSSLPPG